MEKPTLKTPPPPEIAYMDLDAPLFAAASAGEQVMYTAFCPELGKEVASFTSAAAYKNWLEICEDLEIDMDFGYEGDFSTLERRVTYQEKDFSEATKAFDKIIESWLKRSGCKEWVGYVSKSSGEKNFRYDIATVKPYKGSRRETRKPHHLEALRKYATQQAHIKSARGIVEVDDVVCALAQRKGWKGCVVGVDKDARGVQNTHIFIPEEMSKPEFSSQKIVGRLYKNDAGKVLGCGTLFWLYQALAGDSVDSIPGCKGVGSDGAYNLLQEFDGVAAAYLKDAINVVCEKFKKTYEGKGPYKHHTTEEELESCWKTIFMEMSQLVYMKKNQKDTCFWLPIIEEIYNEDT